MWIWWILSLIVLIACMIFAYRMIVSSYKFLPRDKRLPLPFKQQQNGQKDSSADDAWQHLAARLHSVEDSNIYYQTQLSKLQQRLQALEENSAAFDKQPDKNYNANQDDWKELYYEENARREKLENELDAARQQLEETEAALKSIPEKNSDWARLQSDYELQLQELSSLKNEVNLLHQQLSASSRREKELEQVLLSEITVREKYAVLQKEYGALQSQSDSINKAMVELSKKHMDMETRLVRLSELESKLAICEEEKARLKAKLDSHLLG